MSANLAAAKPGGASTPNAGEEDTARDQRSPVLVGLMGAGKTSIGRRLASHLGLPFLDADHEIEVAAGCSIEEIFARHGEAAFRDGERRVITRLLDGPRAVIATGGGAFMDPETREQIRAHGLSIWLKADLDTLYERVRHRRHRPLLNKGDMRAALMRLMEERYPVYAEAEITVESERGPHENVVRSILRALPQHEAPDDAASKRQAGPGRDPL